MLPYLNRLVPAFKTNLGGVPEHGIMFYNWRRDIRGRKANYVKVFFL